LSLLVSMYPFIDAYEPQRQRSWPEIERFFQELPPSLRDWGWLFAQRLARQTSPTGQFKDALKIPATARVVYLPLWHIAAYRRQGIAVPDAQALETHLFASAFMGFCAVRIHDDLLDQDNPQTPVDELLLANLLFMEAIRHLLCLFPSDSLLWDHHARHWKQYTQAVQLDRQRDRTGLAPFDQTALRYIGNKAALLKTFPVAVALRAGQEAQIDLLEELMDDFNVAIQINNDIQSLRSDLEVGHYTPPLVAAALAAGCELGAHPLPHGLRGSLLLSPAVAHTHALAHAYYEKARRLSARLGLDDLTAFIEWHMEDLRHSQEYWQGLCVENVPAFFHKVTEAHHSSHPPVPQVLAGLEKALAFLLFDPECRESWEVQRTGVWDREVLLGDVFSRALVVETLAQQGKAAPGQVESVLEQYRQNGWRYYRDFKALPPDIDDLAQAIRLLRWTAWDESARQRYLETPLCWLEANRAADRGFPVWLTEGIQDQPAAGWVDLGGARCLACEANLLAALAECGQARTRLWVQEGILGLLRRWEDQGYSGVYYYKPACAAAILARCLARLCRQEWLEQETIRSLQGRLHELAQDQSRAPLAGEDSLSMASRLQSAAQVPKLSRDFAGRGISLLLGRQSYDGGWEAVDFFRCPGPAGRTGWHRGRLLTTAAAARTLALLQNLIDP
jgi:hypothetical protein